MTDYLTRKVDSFESDKGLIAGKEYQLQGPKEGDVFKLSQSIDSDWGTGTKSGYQLGTIQNGQLQTYDAFEGFKDVSRNIQSGVESLAGQVSSLQLSPGSSKTFNVNGQNVNIAVKSKQVISGGRGLFTYEATLPDGRKITTQSVKSLANLDNYNFLADIANQAMYGDSYKDFNYFRGSANYNTVRDANMQAYLNSLGTQYGGLNTYHSGQLGNYYQNQSSIDYDTMAGFYQGYATAGLPETPTFYKETEALVGDGAGSYQDLQGNPSQVPSNLQGVDDNRPATQFQAYDPKTGKLLTGTEAEQYVGADQSGFKTATISQKVQVKNKDGEIITVYEDSIPDLIKDGVLPKGTSPVSEGSEPLDVSEVTDTSGNAIIEQSDEMNMWVERLNNAINNSKDKLESGANDAFINGASAAKTGSYATPEQLQALKGKTLREVIEYFGLGTMIDGMGVTEADKVDKLAGTGIQSGQQIKDPNQLSQFKESDIARTTSGNIYRRDIAREQELFDDFAKKYGEPKTDEDWKKFHDFVYEPGSMEDRDFSTSNRFADESGAGTGAGTDGGGGDVSSAYEDTIDFLGENMQESINIDPYKKAESDAEIATERSRQAIADKNLIDAVTLEGMSKDQPIPMSIISRQQAQYQTDEYIENLKLAQDYNNNLILQQIAKGNLLEAQNINQQIASDNYEIQKLKIAKAESEARIDQQQAEALYRQSEHELELQEKYQYTPLNSQAAVDNAITQFGASRVWTDPVSGKKYLKPDYSVDTNDFVANIMSKYPDAGISPNDSLETAQAKLQNSKIYKQQTRLSGSSGGSTSSSPPTGATNEPTNETSEFDYGRKIIASNPNASIEELKTALLEHTDLNVTEINSLLDEYEANKPKPETFSEEWFKAKISEAKNNDYSDEEIKTWLIKNYDNDELFATAKEKGYARLLTGKKTDIGRYVDYLLTL